MVIVAPTELLMGRAGPLVEIWLLLFSVVMVPRLVIPVPISPLDEIWPLLFRVVRVVPDGTSMPLVLITAVIEPLSVTVKLHCHEPDPISCVATRAVLIVVSPLQAVQAVP